MKITSIIIALLDSFCFLLTLMSVTFWLNHNGVRLGLTILVSNDFPKVSVLRLLSAFAIFHIRTNRSRRSLKPFEKWKRWTRFHQQQTKSINSRHLIASPYFANIDILCYLQSIIYNKRLIYVTNGHIERNKGQLTKKGESSGR